MRDFARPMLAPSGSCIRLGPAARSYELKGIHFNMLPAFHGLPSEDPLSFIRDLYGIVEQFPLQGLNEDQLRMRCFPYCLKDRAKSWLTSLALDSLHSWDEVFHNSWLNTTAIRKQLLLDKS